MIDDRIGQLANRLVGRGMGHGAACRVLERLPNETLVAMAGAKSQVAFDSLYENAIAASKASLSEVDEPTEPITDTE